MGKKEKIIICCAFEIFILPETSKINKEIPRDFQGSLCETYIKSSQVGGLWAQPQVDQHKIGFVF